MSPVRVQQHRVLFGLDARLCGFLPGADGNRTASKFVGLDQVAIPVLPTAYENGCRKTSRRIFNPPVERARRLLPAPSKIGFGEKLFVMRHFFHLRV